MKAEKCRSSGRSGKHRPRFLGEAQKIIDILPSDDVNTRVDLPRNLNSQRGLPDHQNGHAFVCAASQHSGSAYQAGEGSRDSQ